MQEQSIIYKENLSLSVNEEIKYHERFGLLKSKELLKKSLIFIIAIGVSALISVLAFKEVPPIISIVTAVVVLVFLGFMYRNSVKKNIVTMCRINYESGICRDSAKRITLKENGVENITPYSKVYVPYGDIERVISDELAFLVRIRGTDKSLVVSKIGQDANVLFNFDNIFREKLGDSFVYEMQGAIK